MHPMEKRFRLPAGLQEGDLPPARQPRLAPQGQAGRASAPAGYPGFVPPGPDLAALAEIADGRRDKRVGWLGMTLAAGAIALLLQGWLLPLLSGAFLAAPMVGIGMELIDYYHSDRSQA